MHRCVRFALVLVCYLSISAGTAHAQGWGWGGWGGWADTPQGSNWPAAWDTSIRDLGSITSTPQRPSRSTLDTYHAVESEVPLRGPPRRRSAVTRPW